MSTYIPYQSGPGAPVFVLDDVDLAAGTYALDTYLGTCGSGSCSDAGSSTDPQYQVLFAPIATPLPAGLPLFARGLGVMGLLLWRRKSTATALAA